MGSKYEYKPFRFWCQRTLPLVYDDSLSYYELLCKTVDYLNNMGEDVSQLANELNKLKEEVKNITFEPEIQSRVDYLFQQYVSDNPSLFQAFSTKSATGNRRNLYVDKVVNFEQNGREYTLEGCVLIGTTLYVSFYKNSTKLCSIQTFDITSSANPLPILKDSGSHADWGHLNNLIFDEETGLIYGTTFTDLNLPALIGINPTTLATASTQTLSKPYINVLKINGEWYLFDSSGNCDVYNGSFQLQRTFQFDAPSSAIQGAYYDGENIVLLRSGYNNALYFVDTFGHAIGNAYLDLPKELECIFEYNGEVYACFNNTGENIDFFVRTDLKYKTEMTWSFSKNNLGRNVKINGTGWTTLGSYPLDNAPVYFSHLRITIEAANGTDIARPEIYVNGANFNVWVNGTHTTSGGTTWIWHMRINGNADTASINVTDMGNLVINPSGTMAYYNTSSPEWDTMGIKVREVYGSNYLNHAQSFNLIS